MLLFPILFALFLGIQVLHRRLLEEQLPAATHRVLPWALIAFHLPLVAYMGLRYAGHADHGLGPLLGPPARAAFYFQALSILNLLFGHGAKLLYRLAHRRRGPGDPELPSRRAFLQGASTAGFAAVSVGAGFGWNQAYGDPQISRHELHWPDLHPGLEGLRILQLSDLHAGPLAGPKTLARWRQLAEREGAELVVLTGDLVEALPGEAEAFHEAFRNFPAPLGRFAILGNHDYFMDPRPLWEGLERQGWHCLENAHALVPRGGARLALLGIQDPQALNGRWRGIRFGPGPRPDLAARGIPEGLFRLCLAHRPTMWGFARRAGAHLTLAGHTHGGQVNLIPGVNFARMLGPHTEGLYEEGGQRLFVSRGLGVVGVPMRVAAPPELVVITLRRG
ncbi:MAG: metallophosphoesterase [Acidobacteria bacterium]|nr:metallophosphoesterase [Acidobacteriota bacterium]